MTRKSMQIDRDKLRAAVRELGNEHVFYVLDDALELLPASKLYQIARQYIDLGSDWFDHCVIEAKTGAPAEVRAALEILFGLLLHSIKEMTTSFSSRRRPAPGKSEWIGTESCRFGSRSSPLKPEPKEYWDRITAWLSSHYNYGRAKMLVIARRKATPDQRKAMPT